MNIRPIEEKDILVVVDLIHRNWDEVVSKYHSQDVINKFRSEVTPDHIRAQMKWKQIFVVESNAEVVATGALANFGSPEIPKHCISNVFVKLTMQNKGIGKFLMEHLFGAARIIGIGTLHVPSSLNAVSFYQQLGFIKDEKQTDLEDEITWMTKVF